MSDLETALQLIQSQITAKQARCVLVGDIPHEASLLGTRDGFLNLTRVLLEFIVGVEEGKYREEGEPPYSDALSSVMYPLPALEIPYIIGMEMFADHAQYMDELQRRVEPLVKERFINDPLFDEPGKVAVSTDASVATSNNADSSENESE